MSDDRFPDPKDLRFDVDTKNVSLAPIFVRIESSMNVIQVLRDYALQLKLQLMVMSAIGWVRDVVFLTNTKTYDEVYQIMSLSGSIGPDTTGQVYGNMVNLVMADMNGATIGGTVEKLIAKGTVEVVVCPVYSDPSRPRPFYFSPPSIFGSPILPSSSDPSPSNPISPSDPSPSNPISSSEPSPSESSSSDPGPIEPSSSDPGPSEPSSSDPGPSQPSSSDSGHSEPSSSELSSPEPSSSDLTS